MANYSTLESALRLPHIEQYLQTLIVRTMQEQGVQVRRPHNTSASPFEFIAWRGGSRVHLARVNEWQRCEDKIARVTLWCRQGGDEDVMNASWFADMGPEAPPSVTCQRCLRFVRDRAATWARLAQLELEES